MKIIERVINDKIEKEKGYLYFIDKEGDVSRICMGRQVPLFNTCKDIPKEKNKPEKVLLLKLKIEPSFLYYIDKGGYICKTKMARGGKKK